MNGSVIIAVFTAVLCIGFINAPKTQAQPTTESENRENRSVHPIVLDQADWNIIGEENSMRFRAKEKEFISKRKTGELLSYYIKFAKDLPQPISMKFYKAIIPIAQSINDKNREAEALSFVGVLYKNLDLTDLFLENCRRSLEISDSIGNIRYSFFRHYELIGYAGLDSVSVVHSLNEIERLANKLNDPEIWLYYHGILSTYADSKNDRKNRLYHMHKTLEFALFRKDSTDIRNTLDHLANIHYEYGKLDSALHYYEEAKKWLLKIEIELNTMMIKMWLAKIEILKGNYNAAMPLIKESLALNEKYKLHWLSSNGNLHLSEIAEATGDYKNALKYFRESLIYKQDGNEEMSTVRASLLRTEYQTTLRDEQIKLLNQENTIRQQEINRATLIRNFSFSGVFVVLILGWLLFNRYKLQKQIETQNVLLEERKRISTELHDDIGAQLSTAKMFLSSVKNSGSAPGGIDMVESSLSILDNSITDLRRIMNDLHTSTIQEKGLLVAVEDLVNRVNQLHRIKFYLSHHGMHERFPSKIEHQLFRIIQELINNSLKHSGASEVILDINRRHDALVMSYDDNGNGTDFNFNHPGFGLLNIESRAKSLGGSVEYSSASGKGFHFVLEVPVTGNTNWS